MARAEETSERVLVLAPTHGDLNMSCSLLGEASIECRACGDVREMCAELERGAGALLLTDAVLASPDARLLERAVAAQPEWSDVPSVVLCGRGCEASLAARAMEQLGNVTILERPVRVTTLVSTLRAALKARRRQYQVRDQLEELRRTEQALRKSEATLGAVIERLPVGVGLVDAEGRTLMLNPEGLRVHGLGSIEEMTADPSRYAADFELREPSGRVLPLDEWPFARVLRGEEVRGEEFLLRRIGHEERVVSYTAVPVESAGRGHTIFVIQDVTERKRSEEELRQAYGLIQGITQGSEDMIAAEDAEYRYIFFNEAYRREFKELWGTELEVGTSMVEAMADWPEEQRKAQALWARALAGESFSVTLDFGPTEEQRRVYDLRFNPVRDAQGNLIGAAHIIRNVTERVRTEEALRRSEATLSAVLDALPVGVVIADAGGRIVRTNEATLEIWGIPPETTDLHGYGEWVAWWPETGERIQAHEWAMSRALTRGEVTRGELIENQPFGGGERRYYLNNVAPVRDEDGRIIGGVGAMLDVTEQRAAEEALRASERRLRTAQEAAGIGTFEWNIRKNRTIWSPELEELYGLQPGTFAGTYEAWAELVHPEDREGAEAAVRAALETDELDAEWRIVLPDGEVRWLEARAWIDRDADGKPTRMLGVNVDITDRKRHEEHLRTVMDELNHRVKNTIAVIGSIARQTIRRSSDLPAFQKSFEERLSSIAVAHGLLTRTEWKGASLRDIIATEVEARVAVRERCTVAGPPLTLRPKAALAMHMVVHELSTNACKYGGLSTAEGRVEIEWSLENSGVSALHFLWTERCARAQQPPDQAGFGTRLIHQIVEYELDGAVLREFGDSGVHYRITIPLETLVE